MIFKILDIALENYIDAKKNNGLQKIYPKSMRKQCKLLTENRHMLKGYQFLKKFGNIVL